MFNITTTKSPWLNSSERSFKFFGDNFTIIMDNSNSKEPHAVKVLTPWEVELKSFIADLGVNSDGIGLFALQLKFGINDIKNLSGEILTGGGDDKKCDLVFVEAEKKFAVIAQCYMSTIERKAASANKAADLNTAISWLISTPIDSLPEGLRGRATELRSAIKSKDIDQLYVWYVHNVPESTNVRNELSTVEHTARAALKTLDPSLQVNVIAEEIGFNSLSSLFDLAQRTIVVTDKIQFTADEVFEVNGGDWSSIVTTIDGHRLYDLYKKYAVDLFSANLRDYLGSRASDSNINNAIKTSADSEPSDFWVYNNGITALTLDYKIGSKARRRGRRSRSSRATWIEITGISIVNGAQTTGSIGSLTSPPSSKLKIPIRFVKTTNENIVENIVRYNNSQNRVQASDFRSTDSIQIRLRREFVNVPNAEYDGGRRGGAADEMRRRKNVLPSYTVGQALASFHGDPVMAYDKKADIWVNDSIYLRYFNDQTTARHIVFVYSLIDAINKKRLALMELSRGNVPLTSQQQSQLNFLEKRGASYLMTMAVSNCLELIISRQLPNKFKTGFIVGTSPEQAAQNWSEIVNIFLALSQQLDPCFIKNRITNEKLKETVSLFAGIISSLSGSYEPVFKKFTSVVEVAS